MTKSEVLGGNSSLRKAYSYQITTVWRDYGSENNPISIGIELGSHHVYFHDRNKELWYDLIFRMDLRVAIFQDLRRNSHDEI